MIKSALVFGVHRDTDNVSLVAETRLLGVGVLRSELATNLTEEDAVRMAVQAVDAGILTGQTRLVQFVLIAIALVVLLGTLSIGRWMGWWP